MRQFSFVYSISYSILFPHLHRMSVGERWMPMSIAQRAIGLRQTREPRPADYVARAKVMVAPDRSMWITIGAAWKFKPGEDGPKDGYSLRITSTPLGWDGRFVLLPPLPIEGEVVPEEPEQSYAVPSTRKRKEKDEVIPL